MLEVGCNLVIAVVLIQCALSKMTPKRLALYHKEKIGT